MNLSMYQASVPVYVRMLNNLVNIMKKAEADAKKRKIDLDVYFNARLAPDMFPFYRQVQIACDMVSRSVARLTGQEIPSTEDREKNFDDLYKRIEHTIDYLGTIQEEAINGTENRKISFEIRGTALELSGMTYLLYFVLPNFYFHITTAYDILRHNGVELTKPDFLGKPPE
jgi:hypothetical protein